MAQTDIKHLLDNGIPVFLAAGNEAELMYNGQLRTSVDETPAIFEGPDCPTAVVGNVDSTRTPHKSSQRGPYV